MTGRLTIYIALSVVSRETIDDGEVRANSAVEEREEMSKTILRKEIRKDREKAQSL